MTLRGETSRNPFGRSSPLLGRLSRLNHKPGRVRTRPLVFGLAGSLFLFIVPSLAANQHGIGHENAANYGVQLVRNEVAVTCQGTGSGFVFNDMWQGIQDDAGWIELGTSYCDPGNTSRWYVYARYTPAWGYTETVIDYDAPSGQHTFKIWNYGGTGGVYWNMSVDGLQLGLYNGGAAGSAGNSADVGLEVTDSRINSTQGHTYNTQLKAWSARNTSVAWSGRDSCADTSSKIYSRWWTDTQWLNSLNTPLTESSC
jgi:hypothetical protein